MASKIKRSAFTLLELLIVIAIIGGLAAIAVTTFPSAGRSGRDANRRSDIKQYQTAMEVYYNRNGNYSATAETNVSGTYCSTTLALPVCPNDPKGTNPYRIIANATTYRIWARLENPTTVTYFYVCSTGETGETTSNPSTTNPC